VVAILILAAYVLPLGVDSFAVVAALSTIPRDRLARWRLSALFVAFEAGMPLIGLALGAPLATAVGQIADYLAAAVLITVGLWMLLRDDDEHASALLRRGGLAAIALGVSISLDELAIGFTLGLAHLPITLVIITIAAQALLASQLGLALGARIGATVRDRAEQLAGLVLLALGAYLVIHRAPT
jgi:putative Mn2+ efflux pump MntP